MKMTAKKGRFLVALHNKTKGRALMQLSFEILADWMAPYKPELEIVSSVRNLQHVQLGIVADRLMGALSSWLPDSCKTFLLSKEKA